MQALVQEEEEALMPTYEYKCEKCGVFEKMQSITENPLTKCPDCEGNVQRLISKNVNVLYKTGGFYTTDNRGSDYNCSEGKCSDNKCSGSSGDKAC